MKVKNIIMTIAAMCMASACGNKDAQSEIKLSGAGATFPEPFYTMVFDNFNNETNNTVSYGGIGSGGGVRNLKDKIVDFAASDAFLSDEEMKEMDEVIHIPTCMGAVVLAFNLPNISEINLSGDVIADIFAGNITKWNDNRISDLNPRLDLPDNDIIPVYRSDGSGTTFIFTHYLSQVSESWKKYYGESKSVDFPKGQAAKGNPGVANTVKETPFSIGYVGSEYAFAQKLSMASLMNACGNIIKPTLASITASANGDIPMDTRTMITNSPDKDAYPISCLTWIIIYKEQNYNNRTEEQAKATIGLMQYILSDKIQQSSTKINYAPLPKKAIEYSLNNLKKATYNGKQISL